MKYVFYILPFIAGIAMTTQAGVNSQLKSAIQDPFMAGFISFITGTLVTGSVVLLSSRPSPTLQQLSSIEIYKYSGGLLGALFVTIIILSAHKIGATNMFSLIIAGQLIAALIFDHYGFIGFKVNQVQPYKLIGVVLLITGSYLIHTK